MTLLITFVTRKYAVQASDRRLTLPGGAVYDDEANKATLLANQASFAFTGLALHSGGRTDELMMESLALTPGSDFGELISRLGTRAAKAINSTRVSARARRTSFVGMGYIGIRREESPYKDPPEDEVSPFLSVVSNAQDLRESWRDWADRDFTPHFVVMREGDDFFLHCAGQPVNQDIRRVLARQLRRCLVRCEGPEPAARILARAIRSVSANNKYVGRDVMCTIVRREYIRSSAMPQAVPFPIYAHLASEKSYFHGFNVNSSTWLYSPGDPQSALHFGPNIIMGGLMVKGLMVGPAGAMTAWSPKAPDRAAGWGK